MKKIICLALTVVMVFAMLSITASAADTAKVTYKVNWSTLYYEGCTFETKYDIEDYFNITKEENLLSFSSKGDGKIRAYVALERFAVSADTKYEYVFQAKNNVDGGYSGAVFAYAEGLPYFVYGGFNNTVDGKSEIDIRRGTHQEANATTDTNFTKTSVILDRSEGYATFKVVYNGYSVTLYALVNSNYTQVGNTITLPSNAYVAIGGYNRESDSNMERTVSIRNAVVYGMNDAAAQNMSSVVDPADALLAYIAEVEGEYNRDDYTTESYVGLLDAITAAKELVEGGSYDEYDIDDAIAVIEEAVYMLVPAENSGDGSNEGEGENAGENEGENAGENAGENTGENAGENAGNETQDPAQTEGTPIDTGVGAPAGTDDVVVVQKGGCGSAILASSALTVVALVGAAVVVSKKKED